MSEQAETPDPTPNQSKIRAERYAALDLLRDNFIKGVTDLIKAASTDDEDHDELLAASLLNIGTGLTMTLVMLARSACRIADALEDIEAVQEWNRANGS